MCQPGSVPHSEGGQLWHTNWFIQGLCASPALPLSLAKDNAGKQIGFFAVYVPPWTFEMKNSWHTNCRILRSCATPHQSQKKNEQLKGGRCQDVVRPGAVRNRTQSKNGFSRKREKNRLEKSPCAGRNDVVQYIGVRERTYLATGGELNCRISNPLKREC